MVATVIDTGQIIERERSAFYDYATSPAGEVPLKLLGEHCPLVQLRVDG
ncbi:MAG: hypothetical protein HYX63_00155 [Gammaproteobacteria bacterium]|nr:hypothetical protein [Gammaproteobacteria bacterium]